LSFVPLIQLLTWKSGDFVVGQAAGLPWANGRPLACPTFADLMLSLGKSVYNFVYSGIYMIYHRGFLKVCFSRGFCNTVLVARCKC
jgi:hypothetical protein